MNCSLVSYPSVVLAQLGRQCRGGGTFFLFPLPLFVLRILFTDDVHAVLAADGLVEEEKYVSWAWPAGTMRVC